MFSKYDLATYDEDTVQRTRSRDSEVGVATGYGLETEGSEFESR
jgi:hypothetical protein